MHLDGTHLDPLREQHLTRTETCTVAHRVLNDALTTFQTELGQSPTGTDLLTAVAITRRYLNADTAHTPHDPADLSTALDLTHQAWTAAVTGNHATAQHATDAVRHILHSIQATPATPVDPNSLWAAVTQASTLTATDPATYVLNALHAPTTRHG